MKRHLLVAVGLATALTQASAVPAQAVQRCGWFDNPTPGNAWLYDRDGEWTVGIQGGHQAQGAWPQLSGSRRVRTGSGSAGYACVCMKLRADNESREVSRILSSRVQPLSVCRGDPAVKGLEPENPLK